MQSKIELVVIKNALESAEVEISYGDDLTTLLRQAFDAPTLPSGVRLYHEHFGKEITPKTPADVDNLMTVQGKIIAVVAPQGLDPISWVIIGVSVLVSVGVALMMPKMTAPNINTTHNQPPSPNNALASRTNSQRLGGRVPDIVGQVWAVPDLIAPTYSVYIDHTEIEYSYLCLGRGLYDVDKALDDTTDIEHISGACVQVFEPNKSFIWNNPQIQFGNSYTDKEREYMGYIAKRYSAVNGQVLPPPDHFLIGNKNLSALAPNIIKTTGEHNFLSLFAVGDSLTIAGADKLGYDDQTDTLNLNGTYRILTVSEKTITLDTPEAVNDDWGRLTTATAQSDLVLSTKSDNLWTDWFYTDGGDYDNVMFNLVAPNGIYTSVDNQHAPADVEILLESEVVNDDNIAVLGTNDVKSAVIVGRGGNKYITPDRSRYTFTHDDDVRRTAAQTFFVNNPHFHRGDRLRVRFRRKSPKLNLQNQTNVDEVRLKDMYGIRPIAGDSVHDDITTVYVKQKATEGAMSLKERKLKLRAFRKLNSPSGELILSKQADDIIYHLATDPKVGNLSPDQLNLPQIRAEMDILRAYFGSDEFGEFCHTFDDNNLSSEETLQVVAQAVFGQLYRLNNQLHLHFERPQPIGVALFNSHNIMPDSYKRSESFGINKNYDGVAVKYQSPKDDAQLTLKTSEIISKPSEHTLIGVRNKRQAYAHLMRIWQKQQYSHKTVEFEGLDESNVVIKSQRIDVADQLRASTAQGVIDNIGVVGGQIVADLSAPLPADFATGTLFVQTLNAEVDSIDVVGLGEYQVALNRLPRHEVAIGLDNVVQATYQLVATHNAGRDAYIVTAKDPSDGISNRISAINYDERYYAFDHATPPA